MPDERIVVLSCVVVVAVGAGAFRTVVCVVVVVVGTGFSTTVVHEVNSAVATARSGVTIISFFIVGVVSFMDSSAQVPRPDVFRVQISESFSPLILDARSHFFRPRALSFRFQDALLQSPRPGPALPAALLSFRFRGLIFLAFLSFEQLAQPLARQFPVGGLRARILDRHAQTRGPMPQRHGGRNLVYVLPTRATRPGKRFLEIGLAKFHYATGEDRWTGSQSGGIFSRP